MSHSQQQAWQNEYQHPAFLSLHDEPQQEILRLAKWFKKEGTLVYGKNILQGPDAQQLRVLDLGCGTGRNLMYLADHYGATGVGYDFVPEAIEHAQKNSGTLPVDFEVRSIGDEYPLDDASFDVVIDMTASHALYEGERDIYLREVNRVLKGDGLFVVRTLTSDGDRNAKNLLNMFAGPEPDTYILPDRGMMEKVFTEESFRERYGEYFDIVELKKTSGYQRWGNQSFKRRYIVAYMQKKNG
jgi:SAM-dependent methyltransferase